MGVTTAVAVPRCKAVEVPNEVLDLPHLAEIIGSRLFAQLGWCQSVAAPPQPRAPKAPAMRLRDVCSEALLHNWQSLPELFHTAGVVPPNPYFDTLTDILTAYAVELPASLLVKRHASDLVCILQDAPLLVRDTLALPKVAAWGAATDCVDVVCWSWNRMTRDARAQQHYSLLLTAAADSRDSFAFLWKRVQARDRHAFLAHDNYAIFAAALTASNRVVINTLWDACKPASASKGQQLGVVGGEALRLGRYDILSWAWGAAVFAQRAAFVAAHPFEPSIAVKRGAKFIAWWRRHAGGVPFGATLEAAAGLDAIVLVKWLWHKRREMGCTEKKDLPVALARATAAGANKTGAFLQQVGGRITEKERDF